MTTLHDLTWLLPFFLYAETHYRFRYFFSFLRKREPEILADAPHRIEPGNTVPLLVLAKDAHQYPCTLRQITVTISQDGAVRSTRQLLTRPLKLRDKWWWTVYPIAPGGLTGWIDINVEFEIETKDVRRLYRNDNYRTSSRRALSVFLSDTPLPRLPGLHLGDGHVHSSYTDDQVEYGAPPGASVLLSRAMGLSFFSVTDHSYDLDDTSDNYLQSDPLLLKWKSLHREVSLLNRRHRNLHTILIGEEVSCRNVRGQNVHLLLYANRQFVHGSGDSAERWFHTRSVFSINEVLENLEGGTAVAAHPKERTPILQQLLLRRGAWSRRDLQSDELSGIQFLNGDYFDGFTRGQHAWTDLLMSGSRIHVLAGNDAHGNFNRFRQIGLPFFTISEHGRQIFGRMRTGLFLGSALDESSVHSAIKKGNIIISDGPVATIHASNVAGKTAFHGERLVGRKFTINITAKSSKEFGFLRRIRLHLGILGNQHETLLFGTRDINQPTFDQTLSFEIHQTAYVRLLVETSTDGSFDTHPHYCLTNPIWFEPE